MLDEKKEKRAEARAKKAAEAKKAMEEAEAQAQHDGGVEPVKRRRQERVVLQSSVERRGLGPRLLFCTAALVHVPPRLPQVIFPASAYLHKLPLMAFTRTQIGIAAGAGVLLVGVFVGYLWWLNNQGPVLARSEDHDPLTGLPVSIKMNPLRDRSTEKAAN